MKESLKKILPSSLYTIIPQIMAPLFPFQAVQQTAITPHYPFIFIPDFRNKVGFFMRENNIELDSDSVIEYGCITKSRLSDDETCFVDEEILAYTFTVSSSDVKEECADMYFEVNDSGVVNFISAS